jgi:hypothetical protein
VPSFFFRNRHEDFFIAPSINFLELAEDSKNRDFLLLFLIHHNLQHETRPYTTGLVLWQQSNKKFQRDTVPAKVLSQCVTV